MPDPSPPVEPIPIALRGHALLSHPMFNKSTAFTRAEREALGLEGLLPPRISTIEEQTRRAYEHIQRKPNAIEKYIGLIALQDRNEHLFYRLLLEHIEQFMPIVYTPTVGQACQEYSHIYRRARGLWITPEDRGHIQRVLSNAPSRHVRLIVVTDNERILGLGDLGAGGIGIPIGKLTLYTVGAGIHPAQCLPVSLDVGTDNEQLLGDELYLGLRRPRLRGPEYDSFVEEFVDAARRVFPEALLQWEDFKKQNAFRLLERYRDRLPSFNDDIQGTAAIGAAAVLVASRMTSVPLREQRIVMLGAGAAGIGIARLLRDVLRRAGLGGDDLIGSILVLDSGGFLHEGRDLAEATKRQFAWPIGMARSRGLPLDRPDDLEAVVRAFKPHVLCGTSGQAGVFTEPVVRAMGEAVRRPVILPLSNPNSKAEATPANLVAWTSGRAVIATGSPFDPVPWEGRTLRFSQANNVYIFPGIGLGALVARARRITDGMFATAAEALAAQVSEEQMRCGALFPPLSGLRECTARVAEAVVHQARADGVAEAEVTDAPAAVRRAMWYPAYPEYRPV